MNHKLKFQLINVKNEILVSGEYPINENTSLLTMLSVIQKAISSERDKESKNNAPTLSNGIDTLKHEAVTKLRELSNRVDSGTLAIEEMLYSVNEWDKQETIKLTFRRNN